MNMWSILYMLAGYVPCSILKSISVGKWYYIIVPSLSTLPHVPCYWSWTISRTIKIRHFAIYLTYSIFLFHFNGIYRWGCVDRVKHGNALWIPLTTLHLLHQYQCDHAMSVSCVVRRSTLFNHQAQRKARSRHHLPRERSSSHTENGVMVCLHICDW